MYGILIEEHGQDVSELSSILNIFGVQVHGTWLIESSRIVRVDHPNPRRQKLRNRRLTEDSDFAPTEQMTLIPVCWRDPFLLIEIARRVSSIQFAQLSDTHYVNAQVRHPLHCIEPGGQRGTGSHALAGFRGSGNMIAQNIASAILKGQSHDDHQEVQEASLRRQSEAAVAMDCWMNIPKLVDQYITPEFRNGKHWDGGATFANRAQWRLSDQIVVSVRIPTSLWANPLHVSHESLVGGIPYYGGLSLITIDRNPFDVVYSVGVKIKKILNELVQIDLPSVIRIFGAGVAEEVRLHNEISREFPGNSSISYDKLLKNPVLTIQGLAHDLERDCSSDFARKVAEQFLHRELPGAPLGHLNESTVRGKGMAFAQIYPQPWASDKFWKNEANQCGLTYEPYKGVEKEDEIVSKELREHANLQLLFRRNSGWNLTTGIDLLAPFRLSALNQAKLGTRWEGERYSLAVVSSANDYVDAHGLNEALDEYSKICFRVVDSHGMEQIGWRRRVLQGDCGFSGH